MPLSRESPTRGDAPGSRAPRRLPGAVPSAALATVLAVSVAQAATAAAIPATTRALGLADWQAGAVTSTTGVVVVLTGAAWGRRSDRAGSRGVVLAAGGAGLVGLLGAVVVLLAVAGTDDVSPGLAWSGLLLARGLLLGLAVAAVGPAVQALLVRGAGGHERVAWIARGGAARGLGTMLGAGLAAGLGAVGPSSVLPVVAAAVVLAGAVAVFGVTTRRSGAPPSPAADRPRPDRAAARLPGVRAALVASLAVFLAMALVQGSFGFLVQDRHGVAGGRATALTGALLLVAGVGSVLAQGVLVPRLRWSPWRLVRTGAGTVVVAVAAYAVPVPLPVLVGVALLFGAGVGAAAAGCTSAAAAAVAAAGADAQGDVAGLVHAVNALAFVVGPALATGGYGLHPAVPAVGALAAAAVAWSVAARRPR